MKIAAVAANGRLGRIVVKEAISRGHDVTAVVREENQTEAEKAITKDIMDLTAEDLAGFDAVISTYANWAPTSPTEYTDVTLHLCDCLSGTDTRLVVVGGAGSLYLDPEHTVRIIDTPDFPEEAKAFVQPAADALDAIRSRDDVAWTFVSPASEFEAEGPRTGKYIQAGEEFTVNAKGESRISYADFAIALVDEAENGGHANQRISFLGE